MLLCCPAAVFVVLSLQQFPDRPSSFNGQEGSESKQRRRLEMEVLSQRTRAVAAERALADVAQDNRKLQQHVMALEVRSGRTVQVGMVHCTKVWVCIRLGTVRSAGSSANLQHWLASGVCMDT